MNMLFATGEADAIVITHGTDTVEEPGFSLHLAAQRDRPVVLRGAIRPARALSANGPVNLFNAVSIAADSQARGSGTLRA